MVSQFPQPVNDLWLVCLFSKTKFLELKVFGVKIKGMFLKKHPFLIFYLIL